MNTSKQKAIEKAYGELYSDFIDENGFLRHFIGTPKELLRHHLANKELYDSKVINLPTMTQVYLRPKSLQGIENNNGWISINSEEDLPKEEGSYFTISNYSEEIIERDFPIFSKTMSSEDEFKWWLKNITHYQQIIKPENPHY